MHGKSMLRCYGIHGIGNGIHCISCICAMVLMEYSLKLLYSQKPELYTILVFLSAIGLILVCYGIHGISCLCAMVFMKYPC